MATSYLPRDENGNIQWPFTSSLKGKDGKTDYTKVGLRVLGLLAALVVGAGVGALVFFFPPFGLALGIAGAVVSGAGAAVAAAFTPFLANVAQRIVKNVRGEPAGETVKFEVSVQPTPARARSAGFPPRPTPRSPVVGAPLAESTSSPVVGAPLAESTSSPVIGTPSAETTSPAIVAEQETPPVFGTSPPVQSPTTQQIENPQQLAPQSVGQETPIPSSTTTPTSSEQRYVEGIETVGGVEHEAAIKQREQEARALAGTLLDMNLDSAAKEFHEKDTDSLAPPPAQIMDRGEPSKAPVSQSKDVDIDAMRRRNTEEMQKEAEAAFDAPKKPTFVGKLKAFWESKNKPPKASGHEYELEDFKTKNTTEAKIKPKNQ